VGVEKVTVISERSGGRSVEKEEEVLAMLCWITILGGMLESRPDLSAY
jgi:hypothetical protein